MTTARRHASITDEMIARSRSRVGKTWQPIEPYFNTEATRDTIGHFCNGIGDTNPLYRDREYAKKTRYGRIVAPPCFLYSVYWPSGMGGYMPGIHAWHSGNTWEWFRPILEGDELTYEVTLTDVVEKPSRMAKKVVIVYDDTVYKNQRGEVVSKVKGWSVLAGRGESGEMGKYREIPKATYTADELEKIYDDYEKEEIRGANPRYWEDVKVGDELTPIVKGPLSPRDMNAWLMGGGSPFMRAHGIFVLYQRRHPAIGMVDTQTGQVDVPELVHMEDTRAQEIGLSAAYDYGCQRMSWLGHLFTNWTGDDGFLWKMHGELRLFNLLGDTTWCKGKVVSKYVDEGRHCVDIECWGENQRGVVTMPGKATVILPSRNHGPVVYPNP
ncbi:MAG: MaoC family dehydratase N-terminal domain-containing protein [Chloroflexi bacterium]|nr:MaoC family dehydratase N-terminal domain-containing protein [Chloroflexota bacterium]